MKLEIEIPDSVIETVVKGIMENFPEASNQCALKCFEFHYPDSEPLDKWFLNFEDTEDDDKKYRIGKAEMMTAFPLLFSKAWSDCKGLTQPPASNNPEIWDNWLCQADATDFDAFAQLACLGKIIYG